MWYVPPASMALRIGCPDQPSSVCPAAQWLKLSPRIAPVKCSVLPLSKDDLFVPVLDELGMLLGVAVVVVVVVVVVDYPPCPVTVRLAQRTA